MIVSPQWVGPTSTTSAVIVCRSDASGDVEIICNGQIFSAPADTSVNDGIVAVELYGLQPDTTYPYSVIGGKSSQFKTQASSPSNVWVGSGSCWSINKADHLAPVLTQQFSLDAYIALGDFPYANTGISKNGETLVDVESSVSAGQSVANYRAAHRAFRRIPGMVRLMSEVPFLYMPDDHEYPFDNAAPGDLALYQSIVTGAGSATQEDLDTAWAAARTAIEEYCIGFPKASTDDSNAVYHSYSLGDLVDIFLVDCINYRGNLGATDNSSKTMLGATQKAWLIDAVTSSTKPWKLIAMGKQPFKGGGNGDTWNASGVNLGYETEKAEILYALRNVTGLLSLAGDQHRWSDQWVSAGDLGTDYPAFSCIVGCPASVDLNATGVNALDQTGVRMAVNGNSNPLVVAQDQCHALVNFTQDRCNRYLLSRNRGLVSLGYILAGSNQVVYE